MMKTYSNGPDIPAAKVTGIRIAAISWFRAEIDRIVDNVYLTCVQTVLYGRCDTKCENLKPIQRVL